MTYCERCDRHFGSYGALYRHERDSSAHNICGDCERDFLTWHGMKEHWVQSPRHFYCQYCNEHYDNRDDLHVHFEDAHYFCSGCSKVFKNEAGLHEHNRQSHYYCAECCRLFRSQSNLDGHLNSSTHKPKSVMCPGRNCGRGFVSMSALILHFESGTCPSGMTRAELNRNVARLITGPEVVQTWATERSWNGYAYECFLCHGTFGALRSLNAHLQSPRHQAKIYRCPNRAGCGTKFSVLSSLTQHVKSGKCGVNRFREVQNAMDALVNGVKRLGMRA
ncbi:hypothetical protein BU17DRAFT_77664 [Hysterangium stoloniferum]|nr:hypothetical protein BU17DRAFT_77664 [Hysterangium stoloniferum]